MIAWMSYVVVVTLALSVAAVLAERAARHSPMPTRWIWTLTIIASLVLPTVVASVSIELPSVFSPAVAQKMIVLREATSVRLPSTVWGVSLADEAGEASDADLWLKAFWWVASAAILVALVISMALVARRKRHWVTAGLGQTQVYVAADVGPAVVGLLRPRIVVPAWLLQAPRSQQNLVLAHEQSHLDAYDPQLLSVALCLLVSMPWNLPLWWQLKRLRRAIEVDCDARVLRGGHKLADYGEALLAVGQRQSRFVGLVAAMSESTSFLEQRIRIMLNQPVQWARTSAAALAALSLAMLAVAAEVSPPNAIEAGARPAQAIMLSAKVLAKYEGYYRLGAQQVLHATREGQRMFTQVTGQAKLEVFARSETEFFTRDRNERGSVVRDAQGRATAIVLHQGGQDITLPRIDEAQARQISDALNAKLKNQVATPGSEAALRRLIAQMRQDPPNVDGISPGLAAAIKEQHPRAQPFFERLGNVKSVEFVSVSEMGWDKYLVRYERGSATWQIQLGANGIIEGSMVTP
jgi:beta-lactamase regulating signal transducer with metallopeptidase domain